MVFLIPLILLAAFVLLGRTGRPTGRVDLPLVWPPAGSRRPVSAPSVAGTARLMAGGFALGVAFAVPARAWMRLIAPDPDFTWSGSIFIAVGFGLLFSGAGLNLAADRQGWGRRGQLAARFLGGLLIIPAFGGAGIMVLPTVLFGGLAIARHDARLPLRVALGVLALAAVVLTTSTIPGDGLGAVRAVLGIALYPLLAWSLTLAARLALSPIAEGSATPVPSP